MKSDNPDELGPRTRAIAEYFIANPTSTHEQIAKYFNVTRGRVSQVLGLRAVQACYPLLARRRMANVLMPKALQTYEHLMAKSMNDAVREKIAGRVLASENVLDGPKIQVQHQISAKSIEELKAIVNRAKSLPSNVIDTEVVDASDAELA